MRESISTSKLPFFTLLAAASLSALFHVREAHAADGSPAKQEEDYSQTPFTEYGEFNEEENEADQTKYFQYGRFFGVSVGVGYLGTTGNRGLLYQGGFPMIDFKVHYWFDFNVALDLGLSTSSMFYETTALNAGHVNVNMMWVGLDLKYYFDTKNLAAPISFANPFILLGAGNLSKTEVSLAQASTTNDSSFTLSAGGGLEFVVSPRKTYFEVEGKLSFPTFQDTYTTVYQSQGINDLTGMFYSVTGNLLFTW